MNIRWCFCLEEAQRMNGGKKFRKRDDSIKKNVYKSLSPTKPCTTRVNQRVSYGKTVDRFP